MDRKPGSTPRIVQKTYDRREQIVCGSSITDIAFIGVEVAKVVFHEPFAKACRKSAQFVGRVFRSGESFYDEMFSKQKAVGNVATRSEVAPPSSEPH